jgi:hypothetical protein
VSFVADVVGVAADLDMNCRIGLEDLGDIAQLLVGRRSERCRIGIELKPVEGEPCLIVYWPRGSSMNAISLLSMP